MRRHKGKGRSTRFGYFDDERREYVIDRPDTPLPWINYLGAESYFGIISNTAGGYSFYRDARLRRLTRYRYNSTPLDVGGRYLYLRDEATMDHWSPTWQPMRRDLDAFSCKHGMGYTIIGSLCLGIEAEILYFVPPGEDHEIWRVRLTNRRSTPAELSLFGAVEFCLWDALDDATNYQRNLNTGEVEVANGVIFHKTEYRERRNHFAYLACSEDVAGFDTSREAFLGAYRGWDRPRVLETGGCTGSIAHGWAPVGVQECHLSLAPGEERDVVFVLGYWENPADRKFDPPGSQTIDKSWVMPTIVRATDPATVDPSFERLRAEWNGLLGGLQVSTPDDHVNRSVNTWNAYQCMVTFNMSRSASGFETGIGRGMGFRDSAQDLLGFVHMVPERARERILDLASTQLATGGAYHQYQPLTKRGNDAVGTGFNDDPMWLILCVAAYVKETGDAAILDERIPYANEEGTESPLYEHLRRCIDYTLERLGPHGLPLIGRADWNDTLNLNAFLETPGESFQTAPNREGGVAESVFIGGLFSLAADELAQIAERNGRAEDATSYRSARADMAAAVSKHGWDGAWFRRAYDHHGNVIGSASNDEGRIFIEPQGINIMAGIGVDDGRARQALDSVSEHLVTPHGIVLHQPAYSRYYLELGEIGSYPPGYKENAGIFCHTNPWIVIAETILRNGDAALEHYLRTNPSAREEISELHKCEPYVYAQMIAGKDAAVPGEAKNSWLTGAAAWNFVAITQWILGIRPTHEGLMIDPCLPRDWIGFAAVRRFRGATYEIEVAKRRGVAGTKTRVEVDGRAVAGRIVPLAEPETTTKVIVTIE